MECVKNTFSITRCHLINKRFVTSQKTVQKGINYNSSIYSCENVDS